MIAPDLVRRNLVRAHPTLNGLDYLEVVDVPDQPARDRQRFLRLFFLRSAPLLGPQQIRVEGGDRISGLRVLTTQLAPSPIPQVSVLIVELDQAGDFSRYTLRLVQSADSDLPPPNIDPQLRALEFSFKVQCPDAGDYAPEPGLVAAAEAAPVEPDLDYLARDYEGLRRLMLARLSALVPGFADRNPADLAVILVELLAHAADLLSYRQDALAQEAYLGTARRRVSVRRHARLVDYRMHDGCNARTWVQFVAAPGTDLVREPAAPAVPAGSLLLTPIAGADAAVTADQARAALEAGALAFETVTPLVSLFAALGEVRIYTWKSPAHALPRGATRATLIGDLTDLRPVVPPGPPAPTRNGLQPGDILVFEELRGPRSGLLADADPVRRAAVRLTSVYATTDPFDATPVTEVAWSSADALPFELVVAAPGLPGTPISVARGNVALADHGVTLAPEPLGAPPPPSLRRVRPAAPDEPVLLPARFQPALARGPLTFAAPGDPSAPASLALRGDPRAAAPALAVTEPGGQTWVPRPDLLGSGPDARAFVAEVDDAGATRLRFGDGLDGARPRTGVALQARYRVGNGPAGNIGADALRHVVHASAGGGPPVIARVRNPLPAEGGAAPETPAEVRQLAPTAFRVQARAVTEADYAAIAQAHPRVQRAVAALTWTGSHHAAVVTVDTLGGRGLDPPLAAELTARLERARQAGHTVWLRAPVYVSLELVLDVCAAPAAFRSDVKAALVRAMVAYFHPDNFSFGQPVHASRVVAAAQAVRGVAHLDLLVLRRQGSLGPAVPVDGQLQIAAHEIVRLDNDPNFAERGVLRVQIRGGK